MIAMTHNSDLIIVGSGILGLATAYLALKEGRSIRVIDASDRPVGASLMNFGHACFTGQSDDAQPVAASARAGWLSAAADAGLWARATGTVVPASTELELQVLREFAEHRGSEQVTTLNREQTRAALAHSEAPVIGGALLPQDLRVSPRQAVPALATWLASQGVTFTWNTRVFSAVDGVVATSRGDFRGTEVVVFPGHGLNQIFPEIAERRQVRTCALAMSLIESPQRLPEAFAMLTGTSLTRYDGFTAMPSVDALREELRRREPALVDCIANLMVTRIPEGLLVGDSHAYALSPEPFIDEKVATLLLDRATAILGIGEPVVIQRWLGSYADSPETNLVLERPDPKTSVAVVTSGIGMTLSFGIAELILSGDRELPDTSFL